MGLPVSSPRRVLLNGVPARILGLGRLVGEPHVTVADDQHRHADDQHPGGRGDDVPGPQVLHVQDQVPGERHHGDVERHADGQGPGLQVDPDHGQDLQVDEQQQQIGQVDLLGRDHFHQFLSTSDQGRHRDHHQTDHLQGAEDGAAQGDDAGIGVLGRHGLIIAKPWDQGKFSSLGNCTGGKPLSWQPWRAQPQPEHPSPTAAPRCPSRP